MRYTKRRLLLLGLYYYLHRLLAVECGVDNVENVDVAPAAASPVSIIALSVSVRSDDGDKRCYGVRKVYLRRRGHVRLVTYAWTAARSTVQRHEYGDEHILSHHFPGRIQFVLAAGVGQISRNFRARKYFGGNISRNTPPRKFIDVC